MNKKKIIYDGDMGGDDLLAIGVMLAHRKRFDIIGISTVFGNVSQPHATHNVLDFLHWMKADDIPVAQGMDMPRDGLRPFGDDAYGEGGIGGVKLKQSPVDAHHGDIADWYITKLHAAKEPVTIICTGPLTNIATLLKKYPHAKDMIGEIIWMGGGIDPRGKDGQRVYEGNTQRTGNITLHSEFNGYQDPQAVNEVLASGVPITIMSSDASQDFVLTPRRQASLARIGGEFGAKLLQMIKVVEPLDMRKYGVSGPFTHDVHAVLYALYPDKYKTMPMPKLSFQESAPIADIHNDTRGKARMDTPVENVQWVTGIQNTGQIFHAMKTSLHRSARHALTFN